VGILVFLLACFIYRKPWSQLDKALLAAILGYVILLALVIGWTTPVMGAVVRYRTPLLPFLLIGGLVLLDHTRSTARWPWLRRSLAV